MVPVDRVRQLLLRYRLVTKEPESVCDVHILGVRWMVCCHSENEDPHSGWQTSMLVKCVSH